MATRRFTKTRRTRERIKPWVEPLEGRNLLAAAVPGVTLDPALVPKFVNPLNPNTLALGNTSFVYQPTGTTTVTKQDGTSATADLYNVGAYQIQEDLGLGLKDAQGNPIKTTVYGYGTSAATATYPGRSFNVQSGQPIAVQWTNGLTSQTHVVQAVDTTVPGLKNSVPAVDPTVLGPNKDSNGNPYYSVDPTTNQVTFSTGIPIVTHVHGGHTDAAYDGTPEQWFTATGPDQQVGPDLKQGTQFTYDNSQQAGTIWYHDHAIGVTRLNVYAGLAGFYIIHDTNENTLIANHTLPAETYDVPLAIQDRMFTAPGVTGPNDPAGLGGQLYYPADVLKGTTAKFPSEHPEFFGDTILVDGQAWPVMHVEPRMYRFRVLDGSQARFYNLRLDVQQGSSQPFFQIGTDDGLLATPVVLNQLLIAPGERADIVVDFSKLAGKTIIMTNTAKGPFPHGAPSFPDTTGQIMAFTVDSPKSSTPDATLTPSTQLNTIPLPNTAGVPVRPLGLFEGVDSYGRLIQKLGSLPLGSDPTKTPIAPSDFIGPGASPTTVQLIRNPDGSQSATEVWQVYNVTADTHPIHLHSTSFQVVSRQKFNWKVVDPATGAFVVTALTGQPTGPDANENGWKDTVRMNPGEVTTILVKFDLPGNYVWHCHILEHEEHDMMNQLVILPAPPLTAAPAVMTAASTTAAPGTGSPTAIAPPTATASTLADAASQPVPLTTGSTSDQVATSTLADPSINPTSVPLDPTLRKKLFGY